MHLETIVFGTSVFICQGYHAGNEESNNERSLMSVEVRSTWCPDSFGVLLSEAEADGRGLHNIGVDASDAVASLISSVTFI